MTSPISLKLSVLSPSWCFANKLTGPNVETEDNARSVANDLSWSITNRSSLLNLTLIIMNNISIMFYLVTLELSIDPIKSYGKCLLRSKCKTAADCFPISFYTK